MDIPRYVRAVENLCNGLPLNLPDIFIIMPFWLALVDIGKLRSSDIYRQIISRMDIATTIAEATPQGAVHFLGVGLQSNRLIAFITLAKAVVGEAFFRFIRLLTAPMIDRAVEKTSIQ